MGVASVLVFPAFVAVVTAVAVYGSSLDLAGTLGLSADANEPLLLGIVLPLTYAAIAFTERAMPYRAEWNRDQGDTRTDLTHLFISGIGTSQVFQATLYALALYAAAGLSTRYGFRLWPVTWPALAQLALALLIAELGHYWYHRCSHEIGLLWRAHAPHHSAPRLYWLNATRFHPLDLFALITFQTVPLILLGADRRALFFYAVFTGAYGQLQHCNAEVKTGPLRWIFATPDWHRWHHSVDARQGNNNYGAVLSVWDLVFGTFHYPGRFDGPVGIGDLPRFPQTWRAQIVAPFRWAQVSREARAE